MCSWVGNQQSRGVVTSRVRTDAVRSLRRQHRDLYQLTYPIPLERSGLILLLGLEIFSALSRQPFLILWSQWMLMIGSGLLRRSCKWCNATINWPKFRAAFCVHHVPQGVIKQKKKEFQDLK
jgi:hypothetical protein